MRGTVTHDGTPPLCSTKMKDGAVLAYRWVKKKIARIVWWAMGMIIGSVLLLALAGMAYLNDSNNFDLTLRLLGNADTINISISGCIALLIDGVKNKPRLQGGSAKIFMILLSVVTVLGLLFSFHVKTLPYMDWTWYARRELFNLNLIVLISTFIFGVLYCIFRNENEQTITW